MDDALRPRIVYTYHIVRIVLILVLMDDALRLALNKRLCRIPLS